MSCFSKTFLGSLLLLSACGLKLDAPKRKSLVVIPPNRWSTLDRVAPGVDLLERDLYFPSQSVSACDYLMQESDKVSTLEKDAANSSNFLVLKEADAKRASLWDLFPIKIDLNNDGKFLDQPAKIGGKTALMLDALEGRIRLTDNPFYEMALIAQGSDLPNKEEFLKLADEESKSSPLMLPFLIAFKLAWSSGILNPYTKRNQIIQKRIASAFPGIFRSDGLVNELRPLDDSLVEALIKNSVPGINSLAAWPTDSKDELKAKETMLAAVLARFKKPLPMFPNNSWAAYFEDSRWALSVAIRALKNKDLTQQACGSVIIQRSFAQMIRIMGYDRPPTSEGHLVDIEKFLMHPESTYLKGCVTPGSFVRNGRYAKLIQTKDRSDFLSNKPDSENFLRLSDAPREFEDCHLKDAKALLAETPELKKSAIPGVRGYADLNSKLSMVGAAGYYFMAMNPGASWWRNTDGSLLALPFSSFKGGLPAIRANGGYLPSQSFALSLGFINLVLPDIEAHHLVMIDSERRETSVDKKILGVRLSFDVRKKNSAGVITSRVESVALLSELVLKFHEALKDLGSWKSESDRWVETRSSAETDPYYKTSIRKDYDDFVASLFGDRQNLLDLVATDDESVRHKVDGLRLAIALHLAAFSYRAANGRANCHASLMTDLATGKEVGVGECNSAQYQTWHAAMQLVGTAFNSPLFLNDGLMPTGQ